ncbi:F-box/LRR-repeat protein [Salix suchowensis]|nr:F-box/LRR-repeat protein [Salix suchowensis]
MDILHYTSAVSDCQAPAAIIIFGDKTTDMKPVVSNMDCVMPEETVMVGDASTSFIFRNGDSSLIHLAHTCYFQPVALVFARDRYKPEGIGEIQFHLTMQKFRDADMSADIYIGVTKETTRTNDSGILIPGRYSETASSTYDHALQKLLTLKAELKSKNHLHLSKFADMDEKKEVLGGLIFSRDRRGESFFGEPFVNSSPFFDSFPTAPYLMNEEDEDENSPRCCLHVYSNMYLVMSYLPPPVDN